MPRPRSELFRQARGFGTILLLVFFSVAPATLPQQREKTATHGQPVIEFTTVPVAGGGDPGKVHPIRGRVIRAEPGQQIVLYSKGETTWWIQPFANQPFTEIHADSTWESSVHPGTLYAVLLVGLYFVLH